MFSLTPLLRRTRVFTPLMALAVIGATLTVPLVDSGSTAGAAVVQSPGLTPGKTLSGVMIKGAKAASDAFGAWRGLPVQSITMYTATNSWANLDNITGLGLTQYYAGSGAHMVWSVPLIPSDGVSTLQKGAAGAYDADFAKVGAGLVAGGDANSTIRLGWEMTGDWFAWNGINDPAAFAGAFRHAVTAMRSVPGQHFTFDFNIAMGNGNPVPMYPGDAYVDIIGADHYDDNWAWQFPVSDHVQSWNLYLTEPYGLNWLASFSAAHGKRMSFGEWGVAHKCDGHGGEDDPYFIDQVHDWVMSHDVAYEDYFQADDSTCSVFKLDSGYFPKAAAEYKRIYTAMGNPAPAPTTTVPAPPTTTVPAPPTTTVPAPPTTTVPAPPTTTVPAPPTTTVPAPPTTTVPAPPTTTVPVPTTTAPRPTTPAPTTTAPRPTTPAPTTTAPRPTTPAPTTTAPRPTTPAPAAGGASIMLSYSPDRSWPGVLNRQSLDHNFYAYYPTSPTVYKVVFSIDGKVYHSETSAPFDLAGTGVNGANAFQPKTLTSGAHTLLATVTTTSNVVLKTQATFFVSSSVGKATAVKATAKLLGVSASAKGTGTAALNGATVKGHKYIVFAASAGTARAEYILDGKVIRIVRSGSGGRSLMAPLETAGLHKGTHHLLVRMVSKTGALSVATAAFKIA